MLCAFWLTCVGDGPSEDVSEAVIGGSVSLLNRILDFYFLFPRDHDFKACFEKKKKIKGVGSHQ